MSDLSQYQFRAASESDCKDIARMIDGSAEGAAAYLYEDIQQGLSPLNMLAQQLVSEVHYSYANTTVVEFDSELVAMALSFPSSGLALEESMLKKFDSSKQQYFKYFSENRITDSWHLDAIFVEDAHRKMGLGMKLLCEVKEQAISFGFPVLQVYVYASNKSAIQFYLNNKFSLAEEISLAEHEYLKQYKSLLLMKCQLLD